MHDRFEDTPAGLDSPGSYHFAIVPSDSVSLASVPRAIFCEVGGSIVIRDKSGNDLSYTLISGAILPFRGVRVLATGTTGVYYGWTS